MMIRHRCWGRASHIHFPLVLLLIRNRVQEKKISSNIQPIDTWVSAEHGSFPPTTVLAGYYYSHQPAAVAAHIKEGKHPKPSTTRKDQPPPSLLLLPTTTLNMMTTPVATVMLVSRGPTGRYVIRIFGSVKIRLLTYTYIPYSQ